MTTYPTDYFDRTDPAKRYERHLFRARNGLQSAELNELQSAFNARATSIGNALLKDGAIISGSACVVDEYTGATTLAAGTVYLRGMVRDVLAATMTVPIDRLLSIGVRLTETVITELEDPTLRDPAPATRNYGEAGAARLRVDATWGWDGDGYAGEFYPIYTVDHGVLQSKEPPPNIDSVVQSIAGYDRDSAGGMYVVNGLQVQRLSDDANGQQVYSIGAGRARVNGFGVTKSAATRFKFDPQPDLKAIRNEPHLSSGPARQTFILDHFPAVSIDAVSMQTQKVATMRHGAYLGTKDPLPDDSVLVIVAVNQGGTWDGTAFVGGTTYVNGTDYKLTGGQVDWSLSGSEPSTGSTYQVVYQHITDVVPDAWTSTSVTITGAVAGSLVSVDYKFALPRIDRIVMDATGRFVMVKGVAATWGPQPPAVPGELLALATIRQTWDAATTVVTDSVRTVPMNDLVAMSNRLDFAVGLIAQQRLESDIHLREAGTKKGIFTDPFLDDSQRDAGVAQTAAVVSGILTLSIDADVFALDADITTPQTLPYANAPALEQPLKTGSMAINPYMAFAPIPAELTLTPPVDRWTVVETVWASPITSRFVVGAGDMSFSTSSTTNVLLATTNHTETLRPIDVRFKIAGFGAGEILDELTFDGLPVTVSA